MATLDDLFTQYLQSIMPPDPAVKRAIAAHDDLRKDLERDEKFGPFIQRTLLSGSYGRDTAILGIKDVDVIIQLNLSKAEISQNKYASETEQSYLLRITREAVERTGRAAKTKPARRSIYVELPAEINETGEDLPELTLDIVPVLIPYDADTDPMEIADRELDRWCYTYPITQLADSITRNQNSQEICGYQSYKSQVKMFKAWKKVQFGQAKTPKGFILECLVAQYHNCEGEHWLDAVQDLFENLCRQWPNPDQLQYIPTVRDISNLNPEQISIAKTMEDAKRVLSAFHASLADIRLARETAETDLLEAAKILQRVFGVDESDGLRFPLPQLDAAEERDGDKEKKDALLRIAATIQKPTGPWYHG